MEIIKNAEKFLEEKDGISKEFLINSLKLNHTEVIKSLNQVEDLL